MVGWWLPQSPQPERRQRQQAAVYCGEERERQGRPAVPYFAPIAGDRPTDKPVEKDRENVRETERKRAGDGRAGVSTGGSLTPRRSSDQTAESVSGTRPDAYKWR